MDEIFYLVHKGPEKSVTHSEKSYITSDRLRAYSDFSDGCSVYKLTGLVPMEYLELVIEEKKPK